MLFGKGKDLSTLQMSVRAVVAFFLTLAMLRIAGVRTLGKKSPFDYVIIIMLGSILSRIVVGASPFMPTTIACLVFVTIHRILARLSYSFDVVGRFTKGEKKSLYKEGVVNQANMKKYNISEKDLQESIREEINENSLENVSEINIERNGKISVIKKLSD
ncbi:MAG: hypothetical protein C5B52_10885 [Bacteroidetes bacterium]|nr:MAG: hypothetical protein C5B52_10885 [Bacteroidota bacterium]